MKSNNIYFPKESNFDLKNTKCAGCPHCDLDIITEKRTDALGIPEYSVTFHCLHEDICNSL